VSNQQPAAPARQHTASSPHTNPLTNNRAKEIKTHVVQNVGSVERHISDYKAIIDNLNSEVQALRTRLAGSSSSSGPDRLHAAAGRSAAASAAAAPLAAESSASAVASKTAAAAAAGGSSAEAETLTWIDALATEINENVEERINLQKALFELEDVNVCNRYELQNIQEMLDAGRGVGGALFPCRVGGRRWGWGVDEGWVRLGAG